MPVAELFVEHVQCYLPTWLLRLFLKWYWYLYGGWDMRKGDVVREQIELDRGNRALEPITTHTDKANEQHYGNDPQFFEEHLGPRLKYSACEWGIKGGSMNSSEERVKSLAEAESNTLAGYQKRLGLDALPKGAKVLECGCGWGSLTLENAKTYPHLKFVSFSNSPQQIEFIRNKAKNLGYNNLTVLVEDYADFATENSKISRKNADRFDAAVAIETIEHARDIRSLLSAVARRLKPGAKLFVHSLLHQTKSFLMSESNWMGRNFFSGGSILALNSYMHLCPPELLITEVIPISGLGYSLTLIAWLEAMEKKKSVFVARYGRKFYEGFRAFYIVCAEAFASNDGYEYMCGYYIFEKR